MSTEGVYIILFSSQLLDYKRFCCIKNLKSGSFYHFLKRNWKGCTSHFHTSFSPISSHCGGSNPTAQTFTLT